MDNKQVTLRDWWLTKPKPDDDDVTRKTIGVAGVASSLNSRAERWFSTAPILKVNGIVELETVDGVCVILQGFINKERTLENGFSEEVFKHFLCGFPIYWENFATSFPKGESADMGASKAHEDGKHADMLDNLNGNPQDFDSCTVDMGLREPEDTGLSNKTSSVHNASSNNISHGINEVRDVRGESQVGTRKSDIEANDSNAKCSDPLSGSSVGVGCSVNAFTEKFNFASSVTDPNENTVLSRTNMKIGQNKKKNNKDMFGSSCREDTHNTPTSARHEIDSQEARLTRSKSKGNLKSGNSAERRRIATSPKSPKTTPKAKKGSKDTYRSPTILSPESFSGKKSRSGRVLLPPLDFWRNQKGLYDRNRQLYGVEEPM